LERAKLELAKAKELDPADASNAADAKALENVVM
jgi:hypothetical protein